MVDSVQSVVDSGADQIIICDGGSDDETISMAMSAGATAVVHCPPGRGVQLAAGLPACDGDFVMVLHADNALPKLAITTLQNEAQRRDPATLWGGFEQRITADDKIYRMIERGNAARVRFRGMVFGDQAMFFNRQMLIDEGGIPPVSLMEDVLISRRLRKRQWPALLPGPVKVSDRRWQNRGVIRQTMLNWRLQIQHKFGADEDLLCRHYQNNPPRNKH